MSNTYPVSIDIEPIPDSLARLTLVKTLDPHQQVIATIQPGKIVTRAYDVYRRIDGQMVIGMMMIEVDLYTNRVTETFCPFGSEQE